MSNLKFTITDAARRNTTTPNLPSGYAASVGLFDVLEHIEDEAAALKLIHSILEPSGRLFLIVPTYQFLFSSEDYAERLGRRLFHRAFARSAPVADLESE